MLPFVGDSLRVSHLFRFHIHMQPAIIVSYIAHQMLLTFPKSSRTFDIPHSQLLFPSVSLCVWCAHILIFNFFFPGDKFWEAEDHTINAGTPWSHILHPRVTFCHSLHPTSGLFLYKTMTLEISFSPYNSVASHLTTNIFLSSFFSIFLVSKH